MITHNVVMIAGSWAGALTVPLVLLSFLIVVVLGFALHSRLTFMVSLDLRSFARYALAMAANVPMTAGLLWLLVDQWKFAMPIAAPGATLILVFVNFLLSRWAIVAGQSRGAV